MNSSLVYLRRGGRGAGGVADWGHAGHGGWGIREFLFSGTPKLRDEGWAWHNKRHSAGTYPRWKAHEPSFSLVVHFGNLLQSALGFYGVRRD